MTDFKKGLLYGIVIATSFGIFVASKLYIADTDTIGVVEGDIALFAYYTKELHPKSKAKVLRLNKLEEFDYVSDESGKYLVKTEETIFLKDGTYETKTYSK